MARRRERPRRPSVMVVIRDQSNSSLSGWTLSQLLELRDSGTVSYEIPFTRHFYEYTLLRSSTDILAEIRELEASIAARLEGVLRWGIIVRCA